MIKRSKPVPIKLSITKSGVRYWFKQNEISRDNGPAIILIGSHQSWLRHGMPYRLDGPARIWDNGNKEWWFDANPVSEYEHMFLTKATYG